MWSTYRDRGNSETADTSRRSMVLFLAGMAVPLAFMAIYFSEEIGTVFYWVITFNATLYRDQGAAEWLWTDIIGAFVLLSGLLWNRDKWLLALVIAAAIYAYPRPSINSLAAMLPLIAIAIGYGKIRILRMIVLIGVLFSFARIADEGHIISVEIPKLTASRLQEAGAKAGDRIWLLPEVDQNGTIYAWGNFLPTKMWMPTRTWYMAAIGDKYLAALYEDMPAWAVTYETLTEQIPSQYLEILLENYQPLSQHRQIRIWRRIDD